MTYQYSPMIETNDDRARRAAHALRTYRDYTGDGATAPDEDVIDFLTDLRHYCDRHGLALGNCDRIAHGHYLEELTKEIGARR